MQRFADQMTLERMHAAWADGTIVGGAGAFDFNLTVPGGELPTAGVTVVGVSPTHRRRGVLRALMRAQLDDAHERGEPLAALWASEETIYGRFGYGLASFCGEITLAHEYTSFAQPFEPQGTVRLIEPDEALEAIPPVFDEIRPEWPGMFSRNRPGGSTARSPILKSVATAQVPSAGSPTSATASSRAYAIYRHKPGFEARQQLDGAPGRRGARRHAGGVARPLGVPARDRLDRDGQSVAAAAGSSALPPARDAAARCAIAWATASGCELLDVGAALSGRTYASDGKIVFEVRRRVLSVERRALAARGRSGRTRARTRPDLALPVQSLGAALLGGISLRIARAAQAGLRSSKDGAIARADSLFRWDRHPWCPEIF